MGGVGCKMRASILVRFLREDSYKQIRGLGGACAERIQPQPSLSANAATNETKNKTTLHNFELANHTVAESSHMVRDRGEACKKQILIGLPLKYKCDTISRNVCFCLLFLPHAR